MQARKSNAGTAKQPSCRASNPAFMKLCHAACVCMCVCTCVYMCVCACACVSSRTPTNRLQSGLHTIPRGIKSVSASALALTPPPHTIVDACPMQCGARCAVRGASARGADLGLAGPRRHLQARSSTPEHHVPCPTCARLCHQSADTDKPGTKLRAYGTGKGAVWHQRVRSTLPQVHRSPSRDHLRNLPEMLTPSNIAL